MSSSKEIIRGSLIGVSRLNIPESNSPSCALELSNGLCIIVFESGIRFFAGHEGVEVDIYPYGNPRSIRNIAAGFVRLSASEGVIGFNTKFIAYKHPPVNRWTRSKPPPF